MMEKYLYFMKNTFKQVICVFIEYWKVLFGRSIKCYFGSYPNQFRLRCVGDKLVRLTSTYVYNSTYVYTFEAPMINVKPAQPELANRMAGKSRSKTLWDRGAA